MNHVKEFLRQVRIKGLTCAGIAGEYRQKGSIRMCFAFNHMEAIFLELCLVQDCVFTRAEFDHAPTNRAPMPTCSLAGYPNRRIKR